MLKRGRDLLVLHYSPILLALFQPRMPRLFKGCMVFSSFCTFIISYFSLMSTPFVRRFTSKSMISARIGKISLSRRKHFSKNSLTFACEVFCVILITNISYFFRFLLCRAIEIKKSVFFTNCNITMRNIS